MSVVHTAVVARKIRRGRERDYEEWLERVVSALHGAAGYDGMTAITAPDSQGSVRTILIRFRSSAALSDWEKTSLRNSLAQDANRFSTAYYQTAPGVETFFALPGALPGPPRWKMCLLTFPAVYLLVNALLFALSHLIRSARDWPAALRMVPVTFLMTVLLTYVCLPALSKAFAAWLFSKAAPPVSRTFEASHS